MVIGKFDWALGAEAFQEVPEDLQENQTLFSVSREKKGSHKLTFVLFD